MITVGHNLLYRLGLVGLGLRLTLGLRLDFRMSIATLWPFTATLVFLCSYCGVIYSHFSTMLSQNGVV